MKMGSQSCSGKVGGSLCQQTWLRTPPQRIETKSSRPRSYKLANRLSFLHGSGLDDCKQYAPCTEEQFGGCECNGAVPYVHAAHRHAHNGRHMLSHQRGAGGPAWCEISAVVLCAWLQGGGLYSLAALKEACEIRSTANGTNQRSTPWQALSQTLASRREWTVHSTWHVSQMVCPLHPVS